MGTAATPPPRITASWVGVPDPVGSPQRSTIAAVAAPGLAPTPRPPGRALLRIAGALTQLSCGACLLIGTIGLVLVEQNQTGGLAPAAGWLVAAMAGLVFGGLVYRGGLVSLLAAAVIDAGFGVLLVTFDHDSLRTLLKILPASDVATIEDALRVAGFVIFGAGAVCLCALPQGIRYVRWFRGAAATRSAISTARGFPPPPVPARSSAYIIPAEDQPGARRRLYMVLGGMAVGVGAGVGVLVSSARPGDAERGPGAAVAIAGHGSAGSATGADKPLASTDPPRTSSITQPVRQTPGDAGAEATSAPGDAGTALADARTATAPPPGGAGATPAPIALHWATPVDDATAERLAILNRLPAPRPIADRHDGSGELDQAVRAAFASRAAFAEARSERPDAFNVGSGGERARGPAIKRIFGKLKAQLRIHDGARVVAGSAWDPAQKAAPWIGWAALDVDFTSKTRTATDVTQTFRVLAILVEEAHGWKIVQTQWSNGGPVQ